MATVCLSIHPGRIRPACIYTCAVASKLYPLRLDDKTRERWEAAAAGENATLATFVKEAVEDRIAGSAPAAPAPRSKAARAQRSVAKAQAACSRETYHRSGEFCKTCGTTPA